MEQAMLYLAVFYIVTKMINYVLDGLNHGKSVMIISENLMKLEIALSVI
ncbi:UNVERIFIED_ORG: uncharacterized membrane-anchored protein YitT (DUF2179 family) [Peribacillus simplex]